MGGGIKPQFEAAKLHFPGRIQLWRRVGVGNLGIKLIYCALGSFTQQGGLGMVSFLVKKLGFLGFFGGYLQGKGVFKAGWDHLEMFFSPHKYQEWDEERVESPGWDNYQHNPEKNVDLKEQETPRAEFPFS